MDQCGRLFRAQKVYAYYLAAEKRVVVAADVVTNPLSDQVHICPNPLAMPLGAHEFIVEGTSRVIHPTPDVSVRIDVQQVYAIGGGNMMPGLFIKAIARP